MEETNLTYFIQKLTKREDLAEEEAYCAARCMANFLKEEEKKSAVASASLSSSSPSSSFPNCSSSSSSSQSSALSPPPPDGPNLLFQIPAFLVLLRAKGETSGEINGFVRALREHMKSVHIEGNLVDIVGTGGDAHETVNISTASAILAAACGLRIAKHGSQRWSSRCSSSDVLEELGVKIDFSNQTDLNACIQNNGIAFFFAQNFHPLLKHMRQIRRGLAVPTVFNLLGPLMNPASAKHMLIGVYDPKFLKIFAEVLRNSNCGRSMVFHGQCLDELSPLGPASVVELTEEGQLKEWIFDPKDYGIEYCTLEDLRGEDAKFNAQKILGTFKGKPGPLADSFSMNAGMAIYAAGKTASLRDAIEMARAALRNGSALKTLEDWKRTTTELSKKNN